MKKIIPWWLKLTIKVFLAKLNLNYRLLKGFGIFVHGDMNIPARAYEIFSTHFSTSKIALPLGSNFHLMELGHGDSVFTALIAKAIGVEKSWLVDVGQFASLESSALHEMLAYLEKKRFQLQFPSAISRLEEVLGFCNCEYKINGVKSLKNIQSRSIDYCFSNAVLEHIDRDQFTRLATELSRVLKINGVCVHRIDFKDHLGGGLNNLRFPSSLWETSLFKKSGLYTNRLRFSEIIKIFQDSGFDCHVSRKVVWDSSPISRHNLAEEFKLLSNQDLLVSGADLILRHQHYQGV